MPSIRLRCIIDSIEERQAMFEREIALPCEPIKGDRIGVDDMDFFIDRRELYAGDKEFPEGRVFYVVKYGLMKPGFEGESPISKLRHTDKYFQDHGWKRIAASKAWITTVET